MRIVVVGVGGVGGLDGGLLAKSGVDVAYVARGEQLRALREQGLSIASPRGTFTVKPVEVSDDAAQLAPADVALVDGLVPHATASMQRDMQAGCRSQLQYQTGAVVRLAAGLGVAVPAHQCLWATLLPQELAARWESRIFGAKMSVCVGALRGLGAEWPRRDRLVQGRCRGREHVL